MKKSSYGPKETWLDQYDKLLMIKRNGDLSEREQHKLDFFEQYFRNR